jgi:hypothetical protein
MPDFAESHISLANQGVVIGKIMNTPASNAAYCSIQGVTTTVRIISGVSVASGDSVLLMKYNQSWFVVGKVVAAPTVPPTAAVTPPNNPPANSPPPPPKPPVRSGSLVVAPVQTATYRDGKWRTDVDGGTSGGDVLQGVYGSYGNNTGCAFYGSKPRTLAGATVTRATIRVHRLRAGSFGAQTSTLRLVTQSSRPSGAPTLGASTSGPRLAVDGTDNSFDIPTSWAQAMVDGTSGGLAIFVSSGSPYMRFSGRASWSAAWTMTIYWTR